MKQIKKLAALWNETRNKRLALASKLMLADIAEKIHKLESNQ